MTTNLKGLTATTPRRTSAAFALSLIVAAALSACGGGGGGNVQPTLSETHSGQQSVADPTLNDEPVIPPTGEDVAPALATTGDKSPGPLEAALGNPKRAGGARSMMAAAPLGQLTPAVPGALNIARIELGQTHMLPNGVKRFEPLKPGGRAQTLRLRPFANALAVIDLSATDAVAPVVEAWRDGERIGTVALNPPSEFPKTEDNGPAYRTGSYSAVLPQAFVDRDVQLKVSARNYAAGNALPLDVTGDIHAEIRILPFFFFGATEANSGRPIATQGQPTTQTTAELQARMPFAITTEAHAAGKVVMDTVTLAPNGTLPARIIRNADDPGAHELGEAIGWGRKINDANGETSMPVLTYAPVAYRYANGTVKSSNTGGLAYQSGSQSETAWWSSAGDWEYAGVFIHEITHNFGLAHAEGSYNDGVYPYPRGSLKGSNWGWDSVHGLLLPPFVPSSSANFAGCHSQSGTQFDEQGRCVKQDIMQGGSGWQAQGQRFGPVSDFTAATAQGSVNNKTVWPLGEDDRGNATFQKLNPATREFERLSLPSDTAFRGIASNLPQKMNVPVHTLMMSVSMTTPEASQIYAPLHYEGNLLYRIDPTNAADLAAVKPRSTGKYRDYCWANGCDFTLHVTYADGSQRYELVQDGLRPWCSWDADIRPETLNPLSGASFKEYAFNVPGGKPLKRVELLYTPRGYEGLPANAKVLVSRDF